MSNLIQQPDTPDKVLNNAKDVIIPVTTQFVDGNVNFQGLKSQNLIDIDYTGVHDIVSNIIMRTVDRFAVDYNEGEDFIIGWLYKKKDVLVLRYM